MAIDKLIEKGNICLEERESIPNAPLWHMGKVAIFESKESFDLLQNTINYLTCKGKQGKPFTDNEKEFMRELYETFWWGGKYHGFNEAAKLANHYVNGNGKTIKVNAEAYKTSVIVRDTMSALKNHIKDLAHKNKPITSLKTINHEFLKSVHVKPLKKQVRSVIKQGYMFDNGILLVEQSNLRLKKTDHRFKLEVNTTKSNNYFLSRWSVNSIYDFEPFEKNHISDIPLGNGFTLQLPDGLSHYLTKIDVAKDFVYKSEWQEIWSN